jgi:glycosyltransferase involved in cell wall biosynthesis
MSTVTVVMAIYNGADFIDEQLKSLAAQTTLPCELVVSDDGCSDTTVQRVCSFPVIPPGTNRASDMARTS